jgi:formate hydrogenlyase subunit 3/multisubunit Na+/H+ antiporter MnhD subunit
MIGAFGMCGAPPLAGFISKWHIALGAVESQQLFFLLIICIGSLLDVIYFFPVIRTAFFAKIPEAETLAKDMEPKVDFYTELPRRLEHKRPLYLFMVIPLAITAVFSILFCLFPNIFGIYSLAQMAVGQIFGGIGQ